MLLNLSNSCIFFCCYTDLPEDLQLKTWKSKFTQASNPYFTLFLQLIEFNGSHISVCLDEKLVSLNVCSKVEIAPTFQIVLGRS